MPKHRSTDKNKKQIAFYSRTATITHNNKTAWANDQVAFAKKYFKGMMHSSPSNIDIYLDGCSGLRRDRPALKKLIRNVKNGSIRTLYTPSFDRLSRDIKEMAKLLHIFKIHRVDVHTAEGRFGQGSIQTDLCYAFASLLHELKCKKYRR